MSHGWTYRYWAMAADGIDSLLPDCKKGWVKAGAVAEMWLRTVARRPEYRP